MTANANPKPGFWERARWSPWSLVIGGSIVTIVCLRADPDDAPAWATGLLVASTIWLALALVKDDREDFLPLILGGIAGISASVISAPTFSTLRLVITILTACVFLPISIAALLRMRRRGR